ncbi:MAG: hypothetical protein WA979_12485 [Pacificimonas sp.]
MIRFFPIAALSILAACGSAEMDAATDRDDDVSQESVDEVYGADEVEDEALDDVDGETRGTQ